MIDSFEQWRIAYPQAAAALTEFLNRYAEPPAGSTAETPESVVQQDIRLRLARQGVLSWRNNVGATPAKCKACKAKQQPVRYGLANDSAKLNERIKSGDLILGIPRIIQPQHVGLKLLQFGSIEVKPPGWNYTGKGREAAQAAWATLIENHGGYAAFSTGDINL